ERYRAAAPGRAGVERMVREYLSVEHRDNLEHGCPSAALLDEIGRGTDATKRAYTEGVLAIVDDIAARLKPDDPVSARGKTLSLPIWSRRYQRSLRPRDRTLGATAIEVPHGRARAGERLRLHPEPAIKDGRATFVGRRSTRPPDRRAVNGGWVDR